MSAVPATAGAAPAPSEGGREAGLAFVRRNAWTLGLLLLLAALFVFTKIIQPRYGVPGIQGLAIGVMPLAFAAAGQAIVVLSGGVDLSIGSIMALTNVTAAVLMQGQSPEATQEVRGHECMHAAPSICRQAAGQRADRGGEAVQGHRRRSHGWRQPRGNSGCR